MRVDSPPQASPTRAKKTSNRWRTPVIRVIAEYEGEPEAGAVALKVRAA